MTSAAPPKSLPSGGSRPSVQGERVIACHLSGERVPLKPKLVALGASTGGPGALSRLLKQLKLPLGAPIIIAQHIEGAFVEDFVTWLSTQVAMPVQLAKEAVELRAGTVYVAGAAGNLGITRDFRFQYCPADPKQLYLPNIDYLFRSISGLKAEVFAALLTGMGGDGAIGLKELAEAGALTYVQSAATCAVAGMPTAALKLSSRHHQAGPDEIARCINSNCLAPARRCYE